MSEGHCPYCGIEVKSKRRIFCSDNCRNIFNKYTVWQRGRDSYSTQILYRDNFTCQSCGEFHALKNGHGNYMPVSDSNLDVHHKLFVCNGGSDEPENLITLCRHCHREVHKRNVDIE